MTAVIALLFIWISWMKNREGVNRDLVDDTVDISLDTAGVPERSRYLLFSLNN